MKKPYSFTSLFYLWYAAWSECLLVKGFSRPLTGGGQSFSHHPSGTGGLDHNLLFSRRSASMIEIPSSSLGKMNDADDSSSHGETQKKQNYRVILDQQGRLLMIDENNPNKKSIPAPVCILDGLSPSVWKGIRPKMNSANTAGQEEEEEENGLFLHTNHIDEKAQHEINMGQLQSCNRLLACSRVTRYWMGPAFGKSGKDIPFDTQFLLVEVSDDSSSNSSGDGPYALLLPLVDAGFRASLHYGDDGELGVMCHAESGDVSVTSSGMRALYVGVGDDPFELLKRGFAHVAEATGSFATLDHKKVPSSIDDFGWCTWDAFYSKVSPDGVLEGVKALRDAGVPPRTLILDDGWQQVSPSPPDWKKKKTETITPSDVIMQEDEAVEKEANPLISSILNVMLAALTKLVEVYYETFVRKAPHGSIGNRIWRFLSTTVLKGQLWNFFDTETDFNRQLSGFPPNHKFQTSSDGEGVSTLQSLVSVLKTQLGMKRVYCWHALHGYWRGVSHELGEAVGVNVTQVRPEPSKHLLRIEPQLAWDTVSLFGVGLLTTASDLKKFYKHMHAPLVEAGVDGVKVDVQSGVSAVGGGVGGGPHLARLYTEAMENSVSEHFSSEDGAANCINCMCHSTENLYRYKVTSVARASDDFYPTRPHSHTVHIVNVAYNSLFLGEICVPDWDMFHSKHESAGLHAAARAVGGCPVYVSDKPGNHDPALLRKLVLPDGSILRAQLPGRPTRDSLFVDVGTDGVSALKVWNKNSYGGVVGAFHVQGVAWNFKTHENEILEPSPPPVTAFVKPHDVETLRDLEGPFAVWLHQSSTLEVLPDGNSHIKPQLHHREWEILTIVPIQSNGEVRWGPIGLADMMNSGGALVQTGKLEQSTTLLAEGQDGGLTTTTAEFSSRGPGRFVAYCQPAPSRILMDVGGSLVTEVPFSHNEENGELTFILPNKNQEGQGNIHQVTTVWDSPP